MAAAAATAPLARVQAQSADTWPNKVVKIIVNFAPGGSTDNAMRPFADRLSRALGQQFVIDNKGGASGALGLEAAVRSPGDGYTFVATPSLSVTVLPNMRKLPFDIFKDLKPVSRFTDATLLFAVHPSVPARNMKEFIAYVKANPGKVNYGSSGNGSAQHLFTALMMSMGDLKMTHVPYKGSAGVTTDLLGGQIQTALPGLAAMMSHIKDGKLRPLAVTGAARSPLLPEVPTLTESGFKGYDAYIWMGLLAPKGTPVAIIDKLNRELITALKAPSVKTYMNNAAIEQIGSTPAEFGAFFRADRDLWARLIKETGARVD